MDLSHRLDELLSHDVTAVLKDGRLLMEMLGLYSEVFLNSKPCSTCEKYHREYYSRLVREGEKIIEQKNNQKMALTKYKLKIPIFHVRGERFRPDQLTDEFVDQKLKEFPTLIRFFDVVKPEAVKADSVPEEASQPVKPAPKQRKKPGPKAKK